MSKRITTIVRALVVHRETDGAYQCSTDGVDHGKGTNGWLPKKAIAVLGDTKPPFILVLAESRLLTRKHLFGYEAATLMGDWTDEQQVAWREISAAASRERSKHNKPRFNRCEGRDFYA